MLGWTLLIRSCHRFIYYVTLVECTSILSEGSMKSTLFTLFTLFFLLCTAIVEATEGGTALDTQVIKIGTKQIVVEVADELHERQLGLMHRTSLEINEGMIFVYPEAQKRSFWMKNTFVPLSIAYIGSDCQIVHMADMTPKSTKGVPSGFPAQFALEMNKGWFDVNAVAIGDTLQGIAHCK